MSKSYASPLRRSARLRSRRTAAVDDSHTLPSSEVSPAPPSSPLSPSTPLLSERIKPLWTSLIRLTLVVLLLMNTYLVFYPVTCPVWELTDPIARFVFFADPQIEGTHKKSEQGTVGAIDLAFNDAYIHHVYRSMIRYKKPTHVVVLGDLFSSQWISDEEFEKRVHRYESMFDFATPYYSLPKKESPVLETLRELDGQTKGFGNGPWLINITGNHDVGYESDLTEARLKRWEAAFGAANFQFWITGKKSPDNKPVSGFGSATEDSSNGEKTVLGSTGVHFLVINSMVLDGTKTESLHSHTWSLVDSVAEERKKLNKSGRPVPPLVIFTHIPFYKRKGICIDGPMTVRDSNGAILEQNMLSRDTSHRLITTLLPSWIFAGHDHEGCKTQRTIWRRKIQNTTLQESITVSVKGAEGQVEERDEIGGYSSRWIESENQTIHEVHHPEDLKEGKLVDPWEYREHVQKLAVAADKSSGTKYQFLTEEDGKEEKLWEIVTETREVTVRSVMGEFGGYAGMWEFGYSGEGNIEYRYHGCSFVQHPIVWGVMILDIVGIVVGGLVVWEKRRKKEKEERKKEREVE